MKKQVSNHDGYFRGFRITQKGLPVSGCSLDFLAFLHQRTQHRPATRLRIDPHLQRLLAHYRECFTVQRAA